MVVEKSSLDLAIVMNNVNSQKGNLIRTGKLLNRSCLLKYWQGKHLPDWKPSLLAYEPEASFRSAAEIFGVEMGTWRPLTSWDIIDYSKYNCNGNLKEKKPKNSLERGRNILKEWELKAFMGCFNC